MKNYYLTLLVLLFYFGVSCQSFEMQLVNTGGSQTLELQIRETTGVRLPIMGQDAIIDITFGIVWPQACGDVNVSVASTQYAIATQSERYTFGTDYVEAFSGVYPIPPPFTFPESWMEDVWYTIATIAVDVPSGLTGTCDFCLATTDLDESTTPNVSFFYPDTSTSDPNDGEFVQQFLPSSCSVTVNLPVELLSFSAKDAESHIALAWASAAEIDFDGYQLERSEDGRNFDKIAWIDGAGDALTPSTYTYQDKDIVAGRTYYYRLAMQDLDGSVEHSSIEVVQLDAKLVVQSYPKPTRDFLNVHIESDAATTGLVNLVDIHGRVVYEQTVDVEKGANNFVVDGQTLTNGVYFLIIRSEAWQHAEEVIFLR